MNTAPDARIAREAAQWLVRLQSGDGGDADGAALARWRAADPRHEAAWQRAEGVLQTLGRAQGPLGAQAVRSADGASRRAATRLLAVLIAAGPAGWAAWRLAPWAAWTATERTATGERRWRDLPDGGRLLLDTASAADVAYTADARRIVLHTGALWVQTAHDPAGRPFLAQTPQGTARALGTRFSVRIAGEATRVAVAEGAVELRPARGGAPVHIAAGMQATATVDSVSAASARDALADGWTEGVLYAEKMPLGAFCAELARYRPGLLRCAPEVAALPVSGAFQLADTDATLAALAASLPVRIELRTRWWVTIGPL
jgi:transmembrane sensor